MLIITNTNSVNYGIYKNKVNKNFKQTAPETVSERTPGFTLTKKQKTALAAGGGAIAGIGGIAAAFKNRNFVKAFNKIFRPYKLTIMETGALKGRDIRELNKKNFLEDFIISLQKRAQDSTQSSNQKYARLPHNGYVVWGESRAKKDFFEWTVNQLEENGVQIIDPKPGASPKFTDVANTWDNFFFRDEKGARTTEQKVADRFKKDGKFNAFVVRDLDKIGNPPKRKYEYPEAHILNDSPNTDSCAEKFGLILAYSADDIGKLEAGTIRAGRAGDHYHIIPYEDEPLDVWIKYIDDAKNVSNPSFITRLLEYTKEVFSKRSKSDMDAMLPHLEYTPSVQCLRYSDPVKKWKNWIEYTAARKGVSADKRCFEMLRALNNISSAKSAYKTPDGVEKLKAEPKMQKIMSMMKKHFLELLKDRPNREQIWEAYSNDYLNGWVDAI